MNTSPILASLSLRASRWRTRMLCAAALALPLLSAAPANAAWNWGVHVKGTGWGLWMDSRGFHGGTQLHSNVSATGDAGRTDFDFTGPLDATMGLMMDLPDGTTATGADVTGVEGNIEIGGGLGTDVIQDYRITIWIQLGSNKWDRICIVIDLGATGTSLARTGFGPGGVNEYGAFGLAHPAAFVFEDSDGVQTSEMRTATEIEFSAPSVIPAPAGALALAAAGLVASRRRRTA